MEIRAAKVYVPAALPASAAAVRANATASARVPVVTGATGPPPFSGLMNGDYSTGNFSQWEVLQNRVYNSTAANYPGTFYGATIITDPTKSQLVARYEVRSGDNPGFSPGTERSQVQAPVSTTGGTEGQIRWYAFSVRFDSTFPQDHADRGFGVTNGWHPTSSTGSGPIQWATHWRNGYWNFLANRQSAPGTYIDTLNMWEIPLGTAWHDVKLQVLFSASDSTGWVQMWHNGVRQTFRNGTQTYSVRTLVPGASSVYYKEGYYSNAMTPTRIVYNTNFRCATTEAGLGVSF